jgi:hypothetical protein
MSTLDREKWTGKKRARVKRELHFLQEKDIKKEQRVTRGSRNPPKHGKRKHCYIVPCVLSNITTPYL